MKKWYANLLLLSIAGIECWASIESFKKVNKNNHRTSQYQVLLPVYIREHQVCSERKIPLAPTPNFSLPSAGAQQLKLRVKTLSGNYHKIRLKSIYLHHIKLPLHLVDKKLSYTNGIEVRILLNDETIDHIFSDNFLSKCLTFRSYLEFEKQHPKEVDIDLSCVSKSTFKDFISLLEKIYSLSDQKQIELVTEQIERKITINKIELVRALEYQYILDRLFTDLDIYNLNESAIRDGINEIYDEECFFKNLKSTTTVDQLFNILVYNPDLEFPVFNKIIKLTKYQRFSKGADNDLDSFIYLFNKIDHFYSADELRALISDYAKSIFFATGPSIQRDNIIAHQQLNQDTFCRWKFKQYDTKGYFYLDDRKITSSELKLIFPDREFFVATTLYIDYNKDMTKFIYTVQEYSNHCNPTFAILYDKASKEHTILGKTFNSHSNSFLPVKMSADGKYVCAGFCEEYINAVGDTKIINIPNGTVISFIGEESRIVYVPYKSRNKHSIAIYDIESNKSTTIDYVTYQTSKIFDISCDNKNVTISILPDRNFYNYGYYGHEKFRNQDFVDDTLGFSGSLESLTFKEKYFKILEHVTTLKCAVVLKILFETGYFDGNCSLNEETQDKLLALIPQNILDLLEDNSGSSLYILD